MWISPEKSKEILYCCGCSCPIRYGLWHPFAGHPELAHKPMDASVMYLSGYPRSSVYLAFSSSDVVQNGEDMFCVSGRFRLRVLNDHNSRDQ